MLKEFTHVINPILQVLNNLQGVFALIGVVPLIMALISKSKNYIEYKRRKKIFGDMGNFFIFVALGSLLIPFAAVAFAFFVLFIILILLNSLFHIESLSHIFFDVVTYSLILLFNILFVKITLIDTRVKAQLIKYGKKKKRYNFLLGANFILFGVALTCTGLLGSIGKIIAQILSFVQLILIFYLSYIFRDKFYIIRETFADIYLVNGEVIRNIKISMLKETRSIVKIKDTSGSEKIIEKSNIFKTIYSYKETYKPVNKLKKE